MGCGREPAPFNRDPRQRGRWSGVRCRFPRSPFGGG